jgi:hypothetical protein
MQPETTSHGKYQVGNLIPALRLFVEARNKALKLGFTDNGGAIHSVERILDILSQRIVYPTLRHINDYKADPNAEISVEAQRARQRRDPIFIEHVRPQRAYAREVITLIGEGCTDDELVDFIRARYRLVLLSREETRRINSLNRSRITDDRIADAGIELVKHSRVEKS